MTIPSKFRGFVDSSGRISRLPVKWGKKAELADWLLEQLEPGRAYSEPELNEIFEEYVDDFALMRRLLVDSGKLERDRYGREYRRVLNA
jgi:hypothetical protein